MKKLLILCLLAACGSSNAKPLVLLELFTSQGCYSCPPAEKLLGSRYVAMDGVLAVEMHVDYWDTLIYRGSSWKDLYSSSKFSERQYNYTRTTGRNAFTPQMIVQGAYNASGTDRKGIDHAIEEVMDLDLAKGVEAKFQQVDGTWQVVFQGLGREVLEATSLHFLPRAETNVTGGENKGKLLVNHNVITKMRRLGLARNGEEVDLGEPSQGEECAVVLQKPNLGVVLGAWRCPT